MLPDRQTDGLNIDRIDAHIYREYAQTKSDGRTDAIQDGSLTFLKNHLINEHLFCKYLFRVYAGKTTKDINLNF